MSLRDLVCLVRSDLWRVTGDATIRSFGRQFLTGVGFKYVFWMRVASWSRSSRRWIVVYPLARFCYRRFMFRFGISIPFTTSIGPGLYIGHFGGIVVSDRAVIGANCNLSQGVTIGAIGSGQRAGAPVLGDNVYVGPGAKIIGHVRIGDGVAIGANAVVVADVPEGVTVAGVPAAVVSQRGSSDYVNKTNYPNGSIDCT